MRVCVIGGGVLGLSHAYDLARRGVDVTVLDRRATGQGAAAVNAGWFVPAEAAPVPAPGVIVQSMKWMLRPDSPLYIRPSVAPDHVRFMLGLWRRSNARDFRAGLQANLALAASTMEILDGWIADGVSMELHSDGLLMAFRSAEKLDHHLDNLDIPRAFGLDPQVLKGDEVRRAEPALRDEVAGGIYFPTERHCDPVSLMAGLRARCVELGVDIQQDAEVNGVERRGDVLTAVLAGGERYAADAVILAAGAWTGPLSRRLGHPVPVRPGKGYAVDIEPPPVKLITMVNLADAKVAVTPLDTRLRLAGTMEFGRLEEGVNDVRIDAIRRAPALYFRDWSDPAEVTIAGAGLRPMTPDGLPVIGRLAGNLYVSSGHGMLGVTLAPGTSRALGDLVIDDRLDPALLPFNPHRFHR